MDNAGSIQPLNLGTFKYIPQCAGTNPFPCDYDKIDMTSMGSYTGAMGMCGSIFNPMGGVGFNPMFGMGMGAMDGTYFDNMKNYQQSWNNYYVDAQKMQRNNDVKLNGAMEAVQETAANLRDRVAQNEQDQIPDAYKNYLNAIKNAYGEASEEELNSRALSLYSQMTGKTLVQDLRDHSHSSLVQGLIQSLSFNLYGRRSAEDNIAEITHQSVPAGEKVEQNVGRFAGIGVVGVGAYGAAKALAGHTGSILKGAAKFLTSKAGIIGAAVAGFVALTSVLTSKIST
ncbi:hypothetical protein J6I39_10135 [bacterium]|nr:hypothetical protein [bacterium]